MEMMLIATRLVLLSSMFAAGDNWPEFRGPSGAGHSDSSGLPRMWGESKNVVWKTPIPGRGWSSPVVWDQQIWLTTATPDGKELFVICLDRESGKVLLNRKLWDIAKPDDTRKYNSFASPTPVIEAGRIYVHFGSYGTACIDTKDGQILWSRQDLPCNHWRGPGSSPILYQNLLVLTFDGYDVQYVVALDKKSGKTVWKSDRTQDFGTDNGDLKKAYSTPVVIEIDGKPQLISPAAAGVVALDPRTGAELWMVKYVGHSMAARPLYGNGFIYLTTGSSREMLAIKPGGKRESTAAHVAWKSNKGIGQMPSPLLVDDLIYCVSDGGVAVCIDANTGMQVWQQRLGSAHTASPLFANGAIYFFADNGSAVVIQPGRRYKEVARNKLDGGSECKATPAICGKSLFIRTDAFVYRIEQR